jgi:hypothetical protein
VEIVDQDLVSQIPQKDARIIGGKREEESSRGSTMEVREMLKNTLGTLENHWGRSPFYMESQIWPLGTFPTSSGDFRSKTRFNRTQNRKNKKTVLQLFGSFSVEFPVQTELGTGRKYPHEKCDNFHIRTPILANLDFLKS